MLLLTGLHPGHAYIRANSPGYPNGQTPLPDNTETIAKLAKEVVHNRYYRKMGPRRSFRR